MLSSRNMIIFVIISIIIFITSALPAERESEKSANIGPCVNNLCPADYKCTNNECIKIRTSFKNATKGESVGPCIHNLCPGNYTCYNNFCYNTNRSLNISSHVEVFV
ncbi:hypothetical protein ACH3XW_24335 [Acanthocheilonema viteae]